MSKNNFSEQYRQYQTYFESVLDSACKAMSFQPPVLADSMRYSLLCGGKRVRPVLFFAALDLFGLDWKAEENFALALEMIHTYSLIHDDLPAMDNDDFRRGKPSNHKAFGEANAILAGDALLSESFHLLLGECGRGERAQRAALELSEGAGARGMIAGQSADLLCERKRLGEEALLFIYRHKTGKLILAPLVMAAHLADKDVNAMRELGENLGILFQMTDDILDVKGESCALGKTTGKDSQEGKLTAVAVYGLERAEALADEYMKRCQNILEGIDGDTDFLKDLVCYVRSRNH